MTAATRRVALAGLPASATWRLLFPFAVAHVVLLGYDLRHPERFLNADRALERFDVVQRFTQAVHSGGDLAGFLAGHGIVGDWLPQALLYLAGGQYFVIAVQAALAIASLAWVRELGLRLGLGSALASGAAALYGVTPHLLVFSHQLASEAIFVPLVVLSFRLGAAGSGAAIGLATLVRPVTLAWPPVYAALSRMHWKKAAFYIELALAPLLLWIVFMFALTGQLSMGRSSHDLGHNLYERMQRMGQRLPAPQQPAVRPPGHTSASLGEYASFAARHPVVTVEFGLRDALTVMFKSGIERLTLDYLDLFPALRASLQDSQHGWRAQAEAHGLLAEAARLAREQPALVLSSAAGTAAFLALIAFALVGATVRMADPERRRLRLLLLAFVLYVVATSQAVDAAQSRHRAPADFALCLLAVLGWARRKEWRLGR